MRAMHADDGDPLRVAPLPRDQDYLLELPETVEVAELFVNAWSDEAPELPPPSPPG